MRKTDKKIEQQLSAALTQVCENALKELTGFQWLTHLVKYPKVENTLKIICVFDTKANLALFNADNKKQQQLNSHIQTELANINITLKNINRHIFYDNEEACRFEHNGNWASRLSNN